jgi:Mn-dependent DtxR family transcriptional regulator
MKLMNERTYVRLPDGALEIFGRIAAEFKVKPSEYIRTAIVNQFEADGFLETGRRIGASLKALGKASR